MKISLLGHRKGWLKNIQIKLFSLVCGLFLWFYVTTDNQFDHTQHVALHVVNKPSGYILADSIPSHVQVRFRGKGKELLSLGYRNKRIEIDLRERGTEAVIPLTKEMIKGMPTGSDIYPLRIVEPETVRVQLDQFASKKVPVTSALVLTPLDGYIQVGDVAFEPDSVVISGPRRVVGRIDEVTTVPRKYNNLLKEISGKVPLAEAEYAMLDYSSKDIHFAVDVQRIGERTIRDVPVRVLNAPTSIKVNVVPSTLSLRIQGGVSVLSKIEKEDIVVSIDYSSRYRYRGKKVPANVQVPPGIIFSESRPKSFELIVER